MPRSRSPPSRNRHRSRSPPRASSSSRPVERRDDYGRSAYAPRSRADDQPRRSPDFARDRERERAAYDARANQEAPSQAEAAPNFERSGLLAAASNTVNGVALKYHEPPEARKPKKKWRLYVYKDGKEVDLLHISRQSCYMIGRDRAVADIPIDHPSCSKQHAALQFRLIVKRNEFGDETKTIKLFLIDLDSANGCSINDTDIDPSRYVELRTGDTIRFGASTREYVLLCSLSAQLIEQLQKRHDNAYVSFSTTINLRQSGIAAQIKASDPKRIMVESDWHSAEGLGPRTWAALKLVLDTLADVSLSKEVESYRNGAASLRGNWTRFVEKAKQYNSLHSLI